MMNRLQRLDRRTLIVLVGAVILALFATLLYAALSRPAAPPPVAEKRTVVVAGVDIPAHTTITTSMLAAVEKPAAGLEPDAVNASQASAVIGTTSLISIPKGSDVTMRLVGHPSQVSLAVSLVPGERAIAIPIDRIKGINGLIQPGDRVDVIAIVPPRGSEGPEARTILRAVKVLAIGRGLDAGASPGPDAADNAPTATLDVTPEQADELALADNNSQLRLALRSPKESAGSQPVEPVNFAPPATAPPVAAPAASASGTPTPKCSPGAVVIIEGDKLEPCG
jgi:pilus assembly protein CpaB